MPNSTTRAEAAVQVHDDVLVLARARIRLRVGRGNARGGSKVQPELQLDALELATAWVKITTARETRACASGCVHAWGRRQNSSSSNRRDEAAVAAQACVASAESRSLARA